MTKYLLTEVNVGSNFWYRLNVGLLKAVTMFEHHFG